MIKLLSIILLSALSFYCSGQKTSNSKVECKDYRHLLREPKVSFKKDSTKLPFPPFHPSMENCLSEDEKQYFIDLIQARKNEIPGDSILISDQFLMWKPFFDRLNYEDPHYRIGLTPEILQKDMEKLIQVPPFIYLVINDTVLIDKSLDPNLKKGDMVLSVNDVPITEYLKYHFKDRYVYAFNLQRFYRFSYAPMYSVKVIRNGKTLEIETEGINYSKVEFAFFKDDLEQKVFPESKTGYISINQFYPNNSRLINQLSGFIKKIKKEGYNNLILDLRKNPGGNGDRFDLLMSIFINKPVVLNSKSQRIRVSEVTQKDYDFLKDEPLGAVVEMPEPYCVREFKTYPKKFEEMNYYVLVSRNTGSTAATFVNLLQYNHAAKLVGEDLLHNATKYGDVALHWWSYYTIEAVSTIEYEEYSLAEDGIIKPDIKIPYSAIDYLNGEDAMLLKLLDYLKVN